MAAIARVGALLYIRAFGSCLSPPFSVEEAFLAANYIAGSLQLDVCVIAYAGVCVCLSFFVCQFVCHSLSVLCRVFFVLVVCRVQVSLFPSNSLSADLQA